MVSVPQRHNTHPGHGPLGRRLGSEQAPDSLTTRTVHRISKRLADVRVSSSCTIHLPSIINSLS